MSFQPKIQVTRVPRKSTSFIFKDVTGNYPDDGSGWGAPNAPAAASDITSLWGGTLPYGASDYVSASSSAGDLTTEAQIVVPIADGVNMLYALYGNSVALVYTIVSGTNRSRLYTTDIALASKFDNVSFLSPAGEYPVKIKSISGNFIDLYAPFPGTANTGVSVYRYWYTQQRVLVLNQGAGKMVNTIATLPLMKDQCVQVCDAVELVELKLASQIFFQRQNYAAADQSAKLLAGTRVKTTATSNCATCG